MTASSREGVPRRFDRDGTRQAILDAAQAEFAERGLSGARVEAIAARTRSAKRMIYYYFGSKDGLYIAVLENVYSAIRTAERNLDLNDLPPVAALRRLVEFTFDYQDANPDFIRLVSVENIHHGAHIGRSTLIRDLNVAVVEMLDGILERGVQQGLFRSDVEAVDVHMLISAFCFFRVSNRHTFGLLFGRDLADPDIRARHKALVADAVLRSLEPRDASGRSAERSFQPERPRPSSRKRAVA